MNSQKILSKNIPSKILNDFASKNICSCKDYEFIKLNPIEYEDLYTILYKQIIYNLSLIKELCFCVDSLGKILTNNKLLIILIAHAINNILVSFCNGETIISEYGKDKIFYMCLPYYIDFNQINRIKISKGINFYNLMQITTNTPDEEIRQICNETIENVSYYILD